MSTGFGLVAYDEAALLLGLSVHTVRRYVSRRLLPHRKVGKKVYFDVGELRSWIESHRVDVNESGGRA